MAGEKAVKCSNLDAGRVTGERQLKLLGRPSELYNVVYTPFVANKKY